MNRLKLIIIKGVSYFYKITYKLFKFSWNINKSPKVLLYTDSRGTEVSPFYKQKNPYYSYLSSLKGYDVKYYFCPYKHTSLLDFLRLYDESEIDYDFYVLHLGIVDFAPRPISSYNDMLSKKRNFLIRKGWLHYFENRDDYLCDYNGEKTLQFMSLDFVKDVLTPELSKIDNLIYVGVNPVLKKWNGNYWRPRPDSINKQLLQDQILLDNILNSISLNAWAEDEIKKYTVDNVHYNSLGLNYIGARVKQELKMLDV
ncbi:hypothetical protein L1D32_05135 [Shewanella insulae]|uniref:hypothetical protein n=1 Tax=Shewanella insulae TaxID=2681496 RepID=UPI001EFC6238|nr:hypothetical protein [Shewanella insulae]MCG9737534.1 hypothetical protein [Shewanella insulae]